MLRRQQAITLPDDDPAEWWIYSSPGVNGLRPHILTYCGLVMPYADINLGQYWLRLRLVAWWHQAITWTNADFSWVRFCGIHRRAIQQLVSKLLFCILILNIMLSKLLPHLPGAKDLIRWWWSYVKQVTLHCLVIMKKYNIVLLGDILSNSWYKCTLLGNTIVYLSDEVGASPVSAAPTASSFST